MRKLRKFHPALETMEVRSLMTAGPAPSLMMSGASPTSIGGNFWVTTTAPQNLQLKTVTYSVTSGPGFVIGSQTWTMASSNYTVTTGATHNLQPDPNTDQYPLNDGWGASWGTEVGTYTITVDATYNNGTTGENSTTQAVAAPSVQSITGNTTAINFGNLGNSNIGFYHTQASNAVTFQAVINSAPAPATLGFVQVADVWERWTYSDGSQKTISFPDSAMILDINPGANTPFVDAYTKQVQSYQGPYTIGGGLTPVGDSPRMPTLTAQLDNPVFCVKMERLDTFDTYLVYQPAGGAYLTLGKDHWVERCTAVYKGSMDLQDAYILQSHPEYWSYSVSPATAKTITGQTFLSVMFWTTNIPLALPGYTTGKSPWGGNDSIEAMPSIYATGWVPSFVTAAHHKRHAWFDAAS